MRFIPTEIASVVLVEPDVFRDERGFFLETFHARKYREAGIACDFVQDNHSRSRRGTLRGLHAQRNKPQAKLIRVIEGEIFDVALDLREGSPTFGKSVCAVLRAETFQQLFIPEGFAHGFCVLSETAQIEYKCSDFYDRDDEIGIRWDSASVRWPIENPLLSAKDAALPPFDEFRRSLERGKR